MSEAALEVLSDDELLGIARTQIVRMRTPIRLSDPVVYIFVTLRIEVTNQTVNYKQLMTLALRIAHRTNVLAHLLDEVFDSSAVECTVRIVESAARLPVDIETIPFTYEK